MKLSKFIVLTLCSLQLSWSQVYKEILPKENIKTLQLFNPQTNDQTPVARLGSEYFILSFDDLEAGFKEYNYTIEHYNADWTPSGIFQSEYLDGYSSSYIRDHENSFNTHQSYTHYRMQIPNQDMQLKLPGNYRIKVYLNDAEKPVFTKRFALYSSENVSVGLQTERSIGTGDLNQKISAIVSSGQLNLTETPDGTVLFLMKNGNWEDNLLLNKASFIQPSQLTYRDQKFVFEGNSEYLWFDTKNTHVSAMTTERTFRENDLYHVVLRPEFQKWNLGYFDESDINGSFYIRNVRLVDQNKNNTEADYIWVHFALDEFDDENGNKELYLVGAFNNWQISPLYRLKITEANYWETSILLKQGYYNYQFAVLDKATQKVSYSAINGSFWQTENQYQALFYYRPWGVRYDILVGYGEVNTRK